MPKPALATRTDYAVPGFFGKLPARGDFIGRHLPKAFLTPWDHWLQTAIAASRKNLDSSWQELYCTSPIWRFVLSSGLCGDRAYAGILMPSMDRVGRYYPLAIAAPLAQDESLLMLLTCNEYWFQQAEQLALDGLDCDHLDLDLFDRQITHLGLPKKPDFFTNNEINVGTWYCPSQDSLASVCCSSILTGNDLSQQDFSQRSLWLTGGSERIAPCLLICKNLPPANGFAALLAGDWQRWGWQETLFTRTGLSSESDTNEKES